MAITLWCAQFIFVESLNEFRLVPGFFYYHFKFPPLRSGTHKETGEAHTEVCFHFTVSSFVLLLHWNAWGGRCRRRSTEWIWTVECVHNTTSGSLGLLLSCVCPDVPAVCLCFVVLCISECIHSPMSSLWNEAWHIPMECTCHTVNMYQYK